MASSSLKRWLFRRSGFDPGFVVLRRSFGDVTSPPGERGSKKQSTRLRVLVVVAGRPAYGVVPCGADDPRILESGTLSPATSRNTPSLRGPQEEV